MGFVPSKAVVTSLVKGSRRKGKIEDAFGLLKKVGEVGAAPNLSLSLQFLDQWLLKVDLQRQFGFKSKLMV